jgi:hypothetical protein
MFLGQFAAPILIQPLINPADSASVWRSLSIILLALALLYFTISTLRRKRVNKTPEIAVTT